MQVFNLSVKQVVSPIALDAMSNPLPGGLYDPAMGPLEQSAAYVCMEKDHQRPCELCRSCMSVICHRHFLVWWESTSA